MLLSAFALAALLRAAPAAPAATIPEAARPKPVDEALARPFASPPSRVKRLPRPAPGFVRNPQMADCDRNRLENAGHPDIPAVQPLSKMPKAHAERAVVRLVDGCPVAVLIAQRTPAP